MSDFATRRSCLSTNATNPHVGSTLNTSCSSVRRGNYRRDCRCLVCRRNAHTSVFGWRRRIRRECEEFAMDESCDEFGGDWEVRRDWNWHCWTTTDRSRNSATEDTGSDDSVDSRERENWDHRRSSKTWWMSKLGEIFSPLYFDQIVRWEPAPLLFVLDQPPAIVLLLEHADPQAFVQADFVFAEKEKAPISFGRASFDRYLSAS